MKRRDAMLHLGLGMGLAGVMKMATAETVEKTKDPAPTASVAGSFDKDRTIRIAMVIFPKMTQLDFTGPFEVFSHLPGAEVAVVAESLTLVKSDEGLQIMPTHSFDTFASADVLFVPGGPGQSDQMTNPAMLAYLRKIGQESAYVTSVCTGSLLLAAAGLLEGYRATCHWMWMDQLSLFDIQPVHERVVIDRNRITGGGITSGLDFGLVVAAELRGDGFAKMLELVMEYNPHPPFHTGTPELAGPAMAQKAREFARPLLTPSIAQSRIAANRLKELRN